MISVKIPVTYKQSHDRLVRTVHLDIQKGTFIINYKYVALPF